MFVLNVIGKGAEPGILRGLGSGPAAILSPGMAFDLPVAEPEALAQARDRTAGLALDINIVAVADRRKKLLIADMDSTIINVECLDELADMAGLKPQIAAITERAMRGELEFEGALRERVGMLKGLGLEALERTYARNRCWRRCGRTVRIPCWCRAASAISPSGWRRRQAFMSSAATPCWMTARI
jgi:phosphoserine phosphatase